MKHSMTKLAVGVALACSVGVSQGALYSFQDDDIDFIIRNNTLITPGSILVPNPILVGDVFVAAFEVPTATIDGVNLIPAGQELTGVAALQLTSCTVGGIASPCTAPGAIYTFGAYTGGMNSILQLGGGQTIGVNGNAGGGATIAFFLNGTAGGADRNLILDRSQLGGATNCTSYTDCIQQASLGVLYQLDGFTSDPDNFWRSTQLNGLGDINDIAALGSTVPVSFAQFALGNFFQAGGVTVGWQTINTGLPCPVTGPGADGCAQFVGSATITGGSGLANGALAHSDFDADKLTVTVPEPGTLALMGLALAGFGFGMRKRSM